MRTMMLAAALLLSLSACVTSGDPYYTSGRDPYGYPAYYTAPTYYHHHHYQPPPRPERPNPPTHHPHTDHPKPDHHKPEHLKPDDMPHHRRP
ncbi:MAG TPA: hypothetical protein VK196_21185 [Magnetospirillum sp.]|nr:hypothetical protein [Magnetospirillum sp.]